MEILSDRTLTQIANVFEKHAEDFAQLAKQNLKDKNKIASSRLHDSITFKVEVLGKNVIAEVSMLEYGRWVDEGRRAGSFPPVDAIKQWIRDKGITYQPSGLQQQNRTLQQRENSLAYLIGRKIERQGIPPSNFIPEWKQDEIIQDIQNEIGDSLGDDIKQIILQETTIYS